MSRDYKSLEGLEAFRKTVARVSSVPDEEWERFVPHLCGRTFDKNEYLIRAGDVADHMYFIVHGLVRCFYSTPDGKEFNKQFAMDNGFAASYQSLILNEPCGYFVQALERSETLALPHQVMNEFYNRHPCWERLGRKNAESMALFRAARERELLLDSLETRYRRFLAEYPGLADRIPQYHIASYLGVTDVALSRVRKRIRS